LWKRKRLSLTSDLHVEKGAEKKGVKGGDPSKKEEREETVNNTGRGSKSQR